MNLSFENTVEAIEQRQNFLRKQKIGICDIVASAERNRINASDLGMEAVQLRDIVTYLQQYPSIHTILFTGGNSKNGPEYFFRILLKELGLTLRLQSDKVPRIHEFLLSHKALKKDLQNGPRKIRTVSLTAPSGAANRAVGSLPEYKTLKKQNPDFNTIDYRVLQYSPFF